MQSILHYLLFFAAVFAIVLVGMFIYIKFAHGRVLPSPDEQRKKAKYMEGAPSGLNGPEGL